jgi:hypothetical protein
MGDKQLRHVIASLLVMGLVGACDSGGADKTAVQAVGPDGKAVTVNVAGVQAGDVKVGADGTVTTPNASVRAGMVEANGAKVELDENGKPKNIKVGDVEVDGEHGVVKAGNTVVDRTNGSVKTAGAEVGSDGSVKTAGAVVGSDGSVKVPGVEVGSDGSVKVPGVNVGGHAAAGGAAHKSCASGNCKQTCSDGGDFTCDGGNCKQSGEGGSCKFSCTGGNCEQACKAGVTCEASCVGGNCKHSGAFAKKSCLGGGCSG